MRYEIHEKQIYFAIESIPCHGVQEFLDRYIPSRKHQHLLFQNKEIFMDNRVCKREDVLQGKYLILPLYGESGPHFPPKRKQIVIPYRDPFCFVALKEAGLLVHSDGGKERTLSEYLEGQRQEKAQAIHRLDRETSGLVFFSRSPLFQPLFDRMLAQKEISREYIALVRGRVKKGECFTITKAIGRDRHDAGKMRIHEGGKEAATCCRCLGGNGEVSALSCHLQTGRTHQIRVHLAAVGHPLLGDELYGKSDERGLALFANRLRFFHPFLEKEITVTADIRQEYRALYKECVGE